jgi:hypothetical protein
MEKEHQFMKNICESLDDAVRYNGNLQLIAKSQRDLATLLAKAVLQTIWDNQKPVPKKK